MPTSNPLRLGQIFRFWFPLASTWLVMSFEGPFLTALIARTAQPKENLAAYGVAFAIALIVEAPVIMMLSAATALVEDADSYRRLKRFTFALNALVTAALLVLILPPVFDVWAVSLIRLPKSVADLTWWALVCLLVWPGAIGYRRFFQGLLIRRGRTRHVLYGTMLRLAAMTTMAFFVWSSGAPGVLVGAAALSAGVFCEALASRWMARSSVREALQTPSSSSLSYTEIVWFYLPLAATSFIGLAAQPVTTFFMGRAAYSLESLAVLPVVISLTFVFRSLGLAYQETAITFLARDGEASRAAVQRFAFLLAGCASLGLAAIAFTPLADVWYRDVSNLSAELVAFAIVPTMIMVPLPALSVILSLQRALLVHARTTMPVTVATGLELALIVSVLLVLVSTTGIPGATLATLAFLIGRLAANGYLVPACLKARPIASKL